MNSSIINQINKSLDEIAQQLKQKKKWNMTLSGGYDSNILLHYVKKSHKKPVNLYSIGGKEIDETPIARDIVKNYKDCTLKCDVVSADSFEQFNDIAWRMDGYLFQDGMFLQYTLAESLEKDKANHILLGEMADQLLNYLFYSKDVRKFEQSYFGSILKIVYLFKISKKRTLKSVLDLFKLRHYLISKGGNHKSNHDVLFDYILKKNGLLLNSFGIQSLYPFLEQDIYDTASDNGLKNIQKKVYKKEVKEVIDPNIAKQLNKIGGTTDIYYLFDKHFEQMEKGILQSSIIRELFSLKKIGEMLDNHKRFWHFIVQLYYIRVVEKIFTESDFNRLIEKEDFTALNTFSC